MLRVTIQENEGAIVTQLYEKNDILVGCADGNDIVLSKHDISKRHSRVIFKEGKLIVLDLQSATGTYINGRRVSTSQVLRCDDKIQIGDFVLTVSVEEQIKTDIEAGIERNSSPQMSESAVPVLEQSSDVESKSDQEIILASSTNRLDKINSELCAVENKINESRDCTQRSEKFVYNISEEALGLGPLDLLLKDPNVNQIMVIGASKVYVQRNECIYLSEYTFASNEILSSVVKRLLTLAKQNADQTNLLVNARLADGSKLQVMVPPLAINGPCITIQKPRRDASTLDNLVHLGTLSSSMAQLLEELTRNGRNVLICGEPGSGKTTTLNAIAQCIPQEERIISIEEVSEISLHQPWWVQLETGPTNSKSKSLVSVPELVKNCAYMYADRLIIGECRKEETLSLLQTISGGQQSILATLLAVNPKDAVARIKSMALQSSSLPISIVQEYIELAKCILVFQTRLRNGNCKITHISEILGFDEQGEPLIQDFFLFVAPDEPGKGEGTFSPTGKIPSNDFRVNELLFAGEVRKPN